MIIDKKNFFLSVPDFTYLYKAKYNPNTRQFESGNEVKITNNLYNLLSVFGYNNRDLEITSNNSLMIIKDYQYKDNIRLASLVIEDKMSLVIEYRLDDVFYQIQSVSVMTGDFIKYVGELRPTASRVTYFMIDVLKSIKIDANDISFYNLIIQDKRSTNEIFDMLTNNHD